MFVPPHCRGKLRALGVQPLDCMFEDSKKPIPLQCVHLRMFLIFGSELVLGPSSRGVF